MGGAVTCSLSPGYKYRRLPDSFWPSALLDVFTDTDPYTKDSNADNAVALPVMQYKCRCTDGYTAGSRRVCSLFWSPGRIAGLVLGSVALSLLLSAAVTVYLRRHQRLRYACAPPIGERPL